MTDIYTAHACLREPLSVVVQVHRVENVLVGVELNAMEKLAGFHVHQVDHLLTADRQSQREHLVGIQSNGCDRVAIALGISARKWHGGELGEGISAKVLAEGTVDDEIVSVDGHVGLSGTLGEELEEADVIVAV